MKEHSSASENPATDPTPIFELFRGAYATELLTAAVAHLGVFAQLVERAQSFDELRGKIGLAERPAHVLFTALRAMGLLTTVGEAIAGRLSNFTAEQKQMLTLSVIAREHLLPGGALYVGDYLGLAAQSFGVLEMVERLRTNLPAGGKSTDNPTTGRADTGAGSSGAASRGAAFIYREGIESAMEQESSARHLTLALAGRAKNVAPALASSAKLQDARLLLDVGGGTGIYSIACLRTYPQLRAIVWDRPEVLRVAAEMAAAYGVADRLELIPGDMFADPLPTGLQSASGADGARPDCILLSNILHDWDVPECRTLVRRCADALPAGGQLLIHDVFLNDALDGPLPIALYSAALFTLTEGRAYSAAEYRSWLSEAGLSVSDEVLPTLIHCGLLVATK